MWQRDFTKQRGEHEEETGSQVDIDGLDVGDLRQGRVGRRDQGCHGQDGRHTLESISPTFYKQLFRQFPCAKNVQT